MNKAAVSYAPVSAAAIGSGNHGSESDAPGRLLTLASDHIASISDRDAVLEIVTSLHEASPARQKEGDRPFRAILEALPVAIYTIDHEGRITFFNEAAVEFWGLRPALGVARWCGAVRLLRPDGMPMAHEESPAAVALQEQHAIRGVEAIAERPDGSRVPFVAYPSLLRNSAGEVTGAVNMLIDISDRKRAELHQKTLVDELNHRVKNMLATVQSLATQTIRSAGVGREVLRSFDGRLFALGRVHDLLTLGQWQSADLGAVVEAVLKPFRAGNEGRIVQNGGPVRLAPREAVLLGMVLHELADNASKHGALSEAGTLSVVWRETVDTAGRRSLRIEWQEANGPAVVRPEKHGFGTRLLERGITSELKGSATLSYDPGGIHCGISVPLMAGDA